MTNVKKRKFSVLLVLIFVFTLMINTVVFAEAAGYYGDVDNNGHVNSVDARLVLRHAAKLDFLPDSVLPCADVNHDARVNSSDARVILRVAARLASAETLPGGASTAPTTQSSSSTTTKAPTTQAPHPTTTKAPTTESPKPAPGTTANQTVHSTVYRTPYGKRYHYDPDCGGKNSYAVSFDQAVASGLTPCQKCVH